MGTVYHDRAAEGLIWMLSTRGARGRSQSVKQEEDEEEG